MSKSEVELWLPDAQIGAPDPQGRALRARKIAVKTAAYLADKHRLTRIGYFGDMVEAFAFSRYRPHSLAEAENRGYIDTEIEPCQEWMDELQEICPTSVYLEGNHEARFAAWCLQKMDTGPISDVVRTLSPAALLSRTRKGRARKKFTWIPWGTSNSYFDVAPNFRFCHSISKRSGPAATQDHLVQWSPMSVAHGHHHNALHIMEPDPITRKTRHGISAGCLCSDAPDWMLGRPTKWTQAMLIVFRSSKNPLDWTPYLAPIFDGRTILSDGKEIRA